jgi:hypothetical protein
MNTITARTSHAPHRVSGAWLEAFFRKMLRLSLGLYDLKSSIARSAEPAHPMPRSPELA